MFESAREDECAQGVEDFEAKALPHLDKLFRVAAWLTQDRVAAETLVQETLTAAFDSIHQLEAESNACVWLVRIMYQTRNKPHRAWRSWKTPRAIETGRDAYESASVVTFEPRTPRDVTEEEMLGALGSLPSSSQEVILLSDIEGLTYKEVADVLGVTVGVVMMRLTRGRKMLRAGLHARVLTRAGTSDKAAQIANK